MARTEDRPRRARLDSALEAEGAEFLVLGLLLIEGIQAMKAYVNYPGYDLVALNPDRNRSCRLQVKSRWATDYERGFPIRNFDCDFVIHVALNRGYRYRRRATSEDGGRRPPDIFVLPVESEKAAQRPSERWEKVFLRDIPGVDSYRENWQLVRRFLLLDDRDPPSSAAPE